MIFNPKSPPRTAVAILTFAVFAAAQTASQPKKLTARDLFYEPVPQSTGGPVNAAVSTAKNPLGLRYTVTQRSADGQFSEVPPKNLFHSGDAIQLKIEFNDAGYLYVIVRGTTGLWKALYPDATTAKNDNRFDRSHSYKSRVFRFDQNVGDEGIFIVFSRDQLANLDELISSLDKSRKAPDSPLGSATRPPLDDAAVGRLRNTYSRDLIIEQPSTDPPNASSAEPQTQANRQHDFGVYVVNPHGQSDTRLVADLTLAHR